MELLAPAGGAEQLKLAIHFGADAVYLAGRRWGMRAKAQNFDEDGLAWAVSYAHERGVRVHVTLNVIMYDDDLTQLPEYLRYLDELGVDALIVADLGAMELARTYAPHVELHVSTQASVTNALSARHYASMGARRIVLAREMTLKQIARLKRDLPQDLELEAFAHGAMCMAYSGRCLLSSALVGPDRSASCGACTQPCRWGWTLSEETNPERKLNLESDERGSYLLSSNDLCMIEYVDELREAGINSLKIEGRNKGGYYAAVTTNAYRHVIDKEEPGPWAQELDATSHRPFSTGFYFGEPLQNPGRIDYARQRQLVAVVESSEPADDGGYITTVSCRNKLFVGSDMDVLSPHMPVRHTKLSATQEFDPKIGHWTDCAGLSCNMRRYRMKLDIKLAPLDLLCAVSSSGR